eukprot:scaffold70307_cov44-Prasinocladus_malaysianus.AAC.1
MLKTDLNSLQYEIQSWAFHLEKHHSVQVFLAPFARKFPKAQVWVAPGQWSWPINLPIAFFGIFSSKVCDMCCVSGPRPGGGLLGTGDRLQGS